MSESIIAVLCLAAACWLLRVTFVLVPAEKLPAAVRRSLDQMAPAVLAALATVEITESASDANPVGMATTVLLLGLVAFVTYRWRNLTATVAAALGGVAVVDLLLPLAVGG
jgi:branched-subunit amino acid transport protein